MTRDEIILMADASGISLYGMGKDRAKFIHYLEAFAKLVAEAEREACAKLCDSTIHDSYIEGYTGHRHSARRECAAAIRAKGQA